MSGADAVRAIDELKAVITANPELRAIVEQATTPQDLAALWQNETFRAAHDQSVQGVTEQDVRDKLSELSDEALDGVSGGVLIGLNQPSQKLSPREAYITLLFGATRGVIAPID